MEKTRKIVCFLENIHEEINKFTQVENTQFITFCIQNKILQKDRKKLVLNY